MTSIRIQSADRVWSADATQGPRVFRVGRDESADIVSTDPAVSRRHAEIRSVAGGWEVVDVGSTLGTWVNGRRIDRAPLTGTTAVGFGDQGRSFQVTVTITAPAAAPPPAPAPVSPFAQPPAPSGSDLPAAPTDPVRPGQVPGVPAQPPINVNPFQSSALPVPPAPQVPSGPAYPPAMDQTIVGGIAAANGFAGPGLLVRRRLDGDLRFPGGRTVRVGRDPALEVHCDDQAVSRLHAVVESRPDGWWWTDRSTSGTFVDGEQMSSFRIDEPMEISLGHPTAGYELEVVPVVAAGQASAGLKRRKRRRVMVIAAAAVALLAIATGITVGAVELLQDDSPSGTDVAGGDSPEPTTTGPSSTVTPVDPAAQREAALDRAKAASVLLQAVDATGQVLWSGSGSIVTDDGLILTNAHVGDPDAPGQGSSEQDPDYLAVSLTTGDDAAPAVAMYRANPIVSDGYLDFAVLQINADIDGSPLTPGELVGRLPEPLPIGDSDDLQTGDRIIALGYPAIGNVSASGDRPLTITEGVVSTFQADPVVGTQRGSIDSDVRLGSGNSGGASINDDGEIIGLNTRVITAASMDAGSITQGSALIVPVNLAADVLEIAEAGGDPSYVSPYLTQMPTDPGLPTGATAVSSGWALEADAGGCAGEQRLTGVSSGDVVLAEFTFEGVPTGLPLSVDFYLDDGTRLDTLSGSWDGDEQPTCVSAPLTVQGNPRSITARLSLGQAGEVVAQNQVTLAGP